MLFLELFIKLKCKAIEFNEEFNSEYIPWVSRILMKIVVVINILEVLMSTLDDRH